MKKVILMAVAVLGALTVSSCSKSDDNNQNSGEQTIPSNYYVVSPDGTTLMKWFNTEVTSIDMQADKVLSKVTKIGDEVFYNCQKLASINFPKNLISIGEGAFYDCKSLKYLTFPESLEAIYSRPFGKIETDHIFYFKGTTPPKIISGIDRSVKEIYVPAESVEVYKKAEGWSEFADRIKAKQ